MIPSPLHPSFNTRTALDMSLRKRTLENDKQDKNVATTILNRMKIHIKNPKQAKSARNFRPDRIFTRVSNSVTPTTVKNKTKSILRVGLQNELTSQTKYKLYAVVLISLILLVAGFVLYMTKKY